MTRTGVPRFGPKREPFSDGFTARLASLLANRDLSVRLTSVFDWFHFYSFTCSTVAAKDALIITI